MSVNKILFSVQNMSPALLGVGAGRVKGGYDMLTGLNNSLNGASNGQSLPGLDKVSLTFKKISEKIVTDMAAITAGAIKESPDLDGDYVIALVDKGQSREVKVYKRSDLLDRFQGTEAEKKELEKKLKNSPLVVFSNADGLPVASSEKSTQMLSSRIHDFLNTNKRSINMLAKAGYDPFAIMKADNSIKKMFSSIGDQKIKDKPEVEKK